MTADVLIAGQGLAGSLLGWELEQAGVSFAIADPGHGRAATMAAAGIVNPITGRRLVKSWRVEALLPLAREAYREIGHELGMSLWRDVRVRREFAGDGERETFAAKQGGGELEPFAGTGDAEGFWIEGGGRVELQPLLAGLRERWRKRGVLRDEAVNVTEAANRHAVVIDCRGVAAARGGEDGFEFVPWEFSKGEIVEIAVDGLASDVVLNRRHWVAPMAAGVAWVGATHEPGRTDAVPGVTARAVLVESARALLARPFAVTGQRAGVRVNVPDKRPVVGRHPTNPRLGVMSGLGAKGALWAPWLARMWAEHWVRGAAFDPAVDVRRFPLGGSGGGAG